MNLITDIYIYISIKNTYLANYFERKRKNQINIKPSTWLPREKEGEIMKKRQKIILIVYAYLVLFFGFMYVPYIEHYAVCMDSYAGHHFRRGLTEILGIEYWSKSKVTNTIDSNMIIAELFVLTALASAAIFLFKDEQNHFNKMEGPFWFFFLDT